MPSWITASSLVNSNSTCLGATMVTTMNSRPKHTPTKVAALTTFLMGPVFLCPQYWAPSTAKPSPTPLTIICNKNWIWFTSATPESASSL